MTAPERVDVGFIGVGTIASAMVSAILSRGEPGGVSVVLSPRSRERSGELARRHEEVRVAGDNQEVVDASEIVFLTVRPEQVEETVAALVFRPDQIVASLAPGWPPSSLADRVAPAHAISQLIPLPMVSLGVGPLVAYPGHAELDRLLDGCGSIVVPEREADIVVFNCLSAVASSFFEAQKTLVDWAVARGIDRSVAHGYVTSLGHGLATESLSGGVEAMSALPAAHETPQGWNAHVREALTAGGVFEEVTTHLDRLWRDRARAYAHLRGPDDETPGPAR